MVETSSKSQVMPGQRNYISSRRELQDLRYFRQELRIWLMLKQSQLIPEASFPTDALQPQRYECLIALRAPLYMHVGEFLAKKLRYEWRSAVAPFELTGPSFLT